MRVIVGMSGASGAILGIRTVERLASLGVEVHLVVSKWGQVMIAQETDYSIDRVRSLAARWYKDADLGAAVSSGSFVTDGMVIVPCSARTVAALASGYGDNLLCRAADVMLKERRPLVLAVREAPLSPIHLRNLLLLAEAGATIFPPAPAFYSRPSSISEMVDYLVVRLLDQLGLHAESANRWAGLGPTAAVPTDRDAGAGAPE